MFLLLGLTVQAQEYWDRKDFEIGNRAIENSWREIGFTWQTESQFNLPDGSFLHLKNSIQKEQVDMLAVIDKANRNKVQREIDLGSPLPQRKPKEKKLFEISGELRERDPNDIFMNPYFSNPYYQNRFNNRYSPYRFSY